MASFLQSTPPGAGLSKDGLGPEQIFLFENHDAAYHIWRRAGFSGRTLVHIDGHHDMWRVPGYETINIANFISFALKDKIVKDVFWIVPDATWSTPDGIAAIDLHTRSLAREYSSNARPVRLGRECVQVSLLDTDLTICSTSALPALATPVLLDIDVDFFVTDSVCYDRRDIPPVLPWCWPDELLERLFTRGISTDCVTISYSVEGEYTPLKWKYLGDELALRLRRAPASDLLRGMVCMREGAVAAAREQEKGAERAYREAMRLLPESYAPALHLVYLYADTGRTDEAKEMYQRALALGGETAIRRSNGFGDYWCGRYAQAEREFRLMKAVDPENPFSWLGLGLLESRRGNWDEAVSLFEHATELNPEFIDAHRALAETLSKKKRNKDAITSYERSLRLALRGSRPIKAFAITEVPTHTILDPDYWKTFSQVAQLYELEGDRTRAMQAYLMSVNGGAHCGVFRWRLARLYLKANLWGKGLREVFRAIAATVSRKVRHFREGLMWARAVMAARLGLMLRK